LYILHGKTFGVKNAFGKEQSSPDWHIVGQCQSQTEGFPFLSGK
jgi:hypothetical protein